MDNVIWVNEDDKVLGEVSREKAHSERLLHRIAVVYLTRPDNQILVQERKSGRLDHSAAGHVDPGESYEEAAKRELEEELGVADVTLLPIGQSRADAEEPEESGRRIRHWYKIFEYQGEPGHLQKEEVNRTFWADPHTIWEDMMNDPKNEKYCGGFKDSLKVFLTAKGLLCEF